MRLHFLRGRAAWTLVEVVIVVAIVGALATAVVVLLDDKKPAPAPNPNPKPSTDIFDSPTELTGVARRDDRQYCVYVVRSGGTERLADGARICIECPVLQNCTGSLKVKVLGDIYDVSLEGGSECGTCPDQVGGVYKGFLEVPPAAPVKLVQEPHDPRKLYCVYTIATGDDRFAEGTTICIECPRTQRCQATMQAIILEKTYSLSGGSECDACSDTKWVFKQE